MLERKSPNEQEGDYLRRNSGNALTDFFLNDVGITQNQFNFGQQLLALGIILLEVRESRKNGAVNKVSSPDNAS